MRLTASMFRRRAVLAAPLAALGPSTAPDDVRDRIRQMNRNPLDDPAVIAGRLPRLLSCGWCYEENGEEVHPHPECPIGYTDPDTTLAVSELQGQLARTQAAILRKAQELEARYVRYAWTEQLAADLRAIAHDTPPVGS